MGLTRPASGVQASLAWGAEGARIDLWDNATGRRCGEWIMVWKDILKLVPGGWDHPTARADANGVDFFAESKDGNLLTTHWSWDELVNRAMMSVTPVKDDS